MAALDPIKAKTNKNSTAPLCNLVANSDRFSLLGKSDPTDHVPLIRLSTFRVIYAIVLCPEAIYIASKWSQEANIKLLHIISHTKTIVCPFMIFIYTGAAFRINFLEFWSWPIRHKIPRCTTISSWVLFNHDQWIPRLPNTSGLAARTTSTCTLNYSWYQVNNGISFSLSLRKNSLEIQPKNAYYFARKPSNIGN